MAGMFIADVAAQKVSRAAMVLLDNVGKTWTRRVVTLTARVQAWTVRIEDRATLLPKPDMLTKLLGNLGYERLPAAFGLLASMRKLGKACLEDGLGLGAMVSAEALQGSGEAVRAGIECVATTYGIFLVGYHLPTMHYVPDR